MSKKFNHILTVEIQCTDIQGQRQARDRLLRWIELNRQTTPLHGFKFRRVGVLTGKMVGAPQDGEQPCDLPRKSLPKPSI